MIKLNLSNDAAKISIKSNAPGAISLTNSAGGGVRDYNRLENKPSISGHTLVGDSSLTEIGVEEITDEEIHSMFK